LPQSKRITYTKPKEPDCRVDHPLPLYGIGEVQRESDIRTTVLIFVITINLIHSPLDYKSSFAAGESLYFIVLDILCVTLPLT